MTHPTGAGKSSFDLIDREIFFQHLGLKRTTVMLDLGCGRGNYTLAAAEIIDRGTIYAVDLWKEGIEALQETANERGLHGVHARVGDAGERIPVEDHAVDLCLMATVFHDLVQDGVHEGAMNDIRRVLKPGGRLAIVEFQKIDGPPGPPIHIRIAPDALTGMIEPFGFSFSKTVELGQFTYLSLFDIQDKFFG